MTEEEKQVRPDRIMQFAWGYAVPLIIESAIYNKVFDTLDSGAMSVEDLSRRTGASVRGLRAACDALVGIELLSKDAQGRYALAPESSAFLVSTKPGFQGGIYKHISRQLLPKWLQIEEIVRTGRPSIAVNQEQEAEFFEKFVEDIFPLSYGAGKVLAGELKLSSASEPVKVLDLATGSGVWGIALAQASPKVTVTAVDWPRVLTVTRRVTGRHGVANRFRFVEGDILTADLGGGYQVATLGHILHSEGRDRSRTLLKRVFDALAPGGTIAIAEFLVNETRTGPVNGLIFAVNMLVNTEAGDTFSFNEIAGWLRDAGFVNARTLDGPGPSPMVLADKPK